MNSLQKLIVLERQATALGFAWPNIDEIINQVISECHEIKHTVLANEGRDRFQEEVGDLLQAAVSLCVYENLDVEQTLAIVTKKFRRRLEALQTIMKDRGYASLEGKSFDELLEFWHEAKVLAPQSPSVSLVKVRPLESKDILEIVDCFSKIGWQKPAPLFEGYIQEQVEGRRLIWVAFHNRKFAGYVTLKWQSSYDYFKQDAIPEIKDLNVLPSFRNQGIGSHLLDIAEEEAKKRSSSVGIGVGLFKDYGAAQKLYVERGYIPHGEGVTYNYQPVKPGDSVCLDDDLVLWLTKNLG